MPTSEVDVADSRSCGACGAPLLEAAQFCEKCGADQAQVSMDRDVAHMLHAGKMRNASQSLVWVAGLMVVGQFLMFGIGGGEDVFGLGVGLGIAALFFGFWRWSKRQPLAATASALGVFVTLHVANAFLDPATIAQGLIVKIVILVILVRGVRAGVILRSHGHRSGA